MSEEARRSFRSRMRLMPQVVLIAACLWLLAGCFYLPTPEHTAIKSQVDFRDRVGDEKSKRPIRPGAINRAQVVQSMGPPLYSSQDGSVVAYVLDTDRDAWVYPLCFEAYTGKKRTYMVRLVFDREDVLTRWDMVHADQSPGTGIMVTIPSFGHVDNSLIEQLNGRGGPPLVATTRWFETRR